MRSLALFALFAIAVLTVLRIVGGVTAPATDLDQRIVAFGEVNGREAVSLGSSVGHAVRFSSMCVDGQEFVATGQDVFEMAAFADVWLERPDPPKLWFVALTPLSHLQDNGAPAEYTTDWRRKRAYRLLWRAGRHSLIDNDWRSVVTSIGAPPLGWTEWRPRLERMADLVSGRETLSPKRFEPWSDNRTITADEDRKSAVQWAATQADRINAVRYYEPDLAERSKAELRRMNRKIQNNGGTMIVVTPPMTDKLTKQTQANLGWDVREFDEIIAALDDEGAVVLRYWDSKEYGKRLDLFRDNAHLNAAGTAQFSQQIGSELRTIGIIAPSQCNPL